LTDWQGGQLGTGSITSSSVVPVAISGLASAVATIAASHTPIGAHACAVTTSGAAVCWGNDFFGQLGDGYSQSNPWPQTVTDFAGIPPPAVPTLSAPTLAALVALFALGGMLLAARRARGRAS
jgi:alpha-tubulin suppressor-like RCC1 family protein